MTFEELWSSVDQYRGVAEFEKYCAAGGDVNAQSSDSEWSLLHLACEHQNLPLIRLLAAKGANLDQQNVDGVTPLHVAVDIDIDSVIQGQGWPQDVEFLTTRLLLSLGANPIITDAQGQTARDWVVAYGEEVLAQFEKLTKQAS